MTTQLVRSTRRRSLAAVTVLGVGCAVAIPVGSAGAAPAGVKTAGLQTAAACTPAQVLQKMSLPQIVGQLFMVGTPATGADATALASIGQRHIGNVMLTGRSYGGTSVPAATAARFRGQVNASSTAGVGLLMSTDQEGGYVQVLQGSGIDRMPTALVQGTWATATLQSSAARWAGQLKASGVNMNLAPVADTVPPGTGVNPPIGAYDREYARSTDPVKAATGAVIRGMQGQGVATTAKHFPGLGVVSANTDTTVNVVDNVTTKTSSFINPFTNASAQGVQAIMMSSARYAKIDNSQLAVFSPAIISWLRSLGFTGVVMTDDIGNAKAVSPYSPAFRAIKAVVSGVDLMLTVNPSLVGQMYDAVLARAKTDAWFQGRVRASAGKVLALKQKHGLLGTC
ncbi:glycoside hydrolase family 3 protein [Flexivirga sp. ID2601S]|uniref:Glycoside hydrolase family 3 protein n=1 Tax=Flexivirga aerilata TaxID=1656889 RepID=A0A849AS42_9MICO|nr:glycoside hydrolase family 3 protein [Flexivirga aerilata]NNG41100.1 glycoside hydrolase family 3 protein [Flexivirga aerilata]